MTSLSYPYTLTAGQPQNVNQLNSNLNAVATVLNGNVDNTNLASGAALANLSAGSVTSAKLASGAALANLAAGSVTDDKLASSPLGQYKTLAAGKAFARAGMVVGNYWWNDETGSGALWSNGANMIPLSTKPVVPPLVRIAASDLAVSGKTTYLRFVATSLINATAPSTSQITLGLHQLTSVTGATADELFPSVNTTRSGTGITLPNSAAGAYGLDSGDFGLVADGYYIVASKVAVAAIPAGHASFTAWQLLYRNA